MEHDDRRDALAEFSAGNDQESRNLPVPSQVFAAPAERVFGAQAVAVKRDEPEIFATLSKLAAVAADDWYYRFPVKGKDGQTSYIEGPSIKCANNVARLFGNCDVDVRVIDAGDSYMFYARFMDLQTGYSLVRPFRQRKNQRTMKTDAGRAEDIVFQIGASKAIRNVICNALELFTGFGMEEAKKSVIDKVGKKLPEYKDRVVARLKDLRVDLSRAERLRGRVLKEWTAADVALTIAEIKSINDGMSTADDTWPTREEEAAADKGGDDAKVEAKPDTSSPQSAKPGAAESRPASEDAPANGAPASEAGTGQKAKAEVPQQTTQATQQDAPATQQKSAETQQRADQAPAAPKTAAEYEPYALAYIEAATDPAALEAKWKGEKSLRNSVNIDPETRDDLKAAVDAKAKAIRDAAKGS